MALCRGPLGCEDLHLLYERHTAADKEKRTARVEELALSNSLTLAALVELLEEQGISRREEVLAKAKEIRDREELDS